MKKSVYTLAFVALFALAGHSQNSGTAPKQESVKPGNVSIDGTLSVDDAVPSKDKTAKKQEGATQNGGTRMAISEKGTPAPKNKEKDTKTSDSPK